MGPTNSGKTQYLVNQLRGPFRGKFDYIVLFCPTFVKNKTYDRFADNDSRIFVVVCLQHEIESWLKLASYFFEKTNTLFVLDDCKASKDVKGRTSQLVNLGFSARHDGISVWVLTQQITSIAKPFRENVAAIVLFYTPSGKTTKAIFEDYAGEIKHDEYKELIAWLKERKFSHLVFSLRYPYGIQTEIRKTIYTPWIIQLNFTSLQRFHNFWLNCISKQWKHKPELSNPRARKICAPCFLIAIP